MAKPIDESASPFQEAVPLLPPPSIPYKPDTRMKNMKWVDTFLASIKGGSTVIGAAAAAGVHYTLPYQTRERNEEFRQRWKEAAEIGTELLEEEAQRRAYHGTDRPVFFKGILCGTYKEYDNKLLMDLLRVRKPEKYKNADDDHVRGNVTININMDIVSSREELGGNTASVIDVEVVEPGDVKQESAGIPEAAQIPHQ